MSLASGKKKQKKHHLQHHEIQAYFFGRWSLSHSFILDIRVIIIIRASAEDIVLFWSPWANGKSIPPCTKPKLTALRDPRPSLVWAVHSEGLNKINFWYDMTKAQERIYELCARCNEVLDSYGRKQKNTFQGSNKYVQLSEMGLKAGWGPLDILTHRLLNTFVLYLH